MYLSFHFIPFFILARLSFFLPVTGTMWKLKSSTVQSQKNNQKFRCFNN